MPPHQRRRRASSPSSACSHSSPWGSASATASCSCTTLGWPAQVCTRHVPRALHPVCIRPATIGNPERVAMTNTAGSAANKCGPCSGLSVKWAVYASDVMEYASTVTLTATLLVVSKGWMISRHQLKRKTKILQGLTTVVRLTSCCLLLTTRASCLLLATARSLRRKCLACRVEALCH